MNSPISKRKKQISFRRTLISLMFIFGFEGVAISGEGCELDPDASCIPVEAERLDKPSWTTK